MNHASFVFLRLHMKHKLLSAWSRQTVPLTIWHPFQVVCRICQKLVHPGTGILCSASGCEAVYHLICSKRRLEVSSSQQFMCPQHVSHVAFYSMVLITFYVMTIYVVVDQQLNMGRGVCHQWTKYVVKLLYIFILFR